MQVKYSCFTPQRSTEVCVCVTVSTERINSTPHVTCGSSLQIFDVSIDAPPLGLIIARLL